MVTHHYNYFHFDFGISLFKNYRAPKSRHVVTISPTGPIPYVDYHVSPVKFDIPSFREDNEEEGFEGGEQSCLGCPDHEPDEQEFEDDNEDLGDENGEEVDDEE